MWCGLPSFFCLLVCLRAAPLLCLCLFLCLQLTTFVVIIVACFGVLPFPFFFFFLWGCVVVSVLVAVRGGSLLGGGVCAAFAWRSVVGSALRCGCVSWSLGASARSFSGACVRVGFSSSARASAFARLWAARVGFGCVVRAVGGRWVVSVPAAPCVASSLRAFVGGAA